MYTSAGRRVQTRRGNDCKRRRTIVNRAFTRVRAACRRSRPTLSPTLIGARASTKTSRQKRRALSIKSAPFNARARRRRRRRCRRHSRRLVVQSSSRFMLSKIVWPIVSSGRAHVREQVTVTNTITIVGWLPLLSTAAARRHTRMPSPPIERRTHEPRASVRTSRSSARLCSQSGARLPARSVHNVVRRGSGGDSDGARARARALNRVGVRWLAVRQCAPHL